MTDPTLDALLTACRAHHGGEPSDVLRRATGAFVARATEDSATLAPAAAALPHLHPAGAAWLALTLGAAIEGGAPVDLTGPAVVDLLLSWLPKLPVDEADADTDADAVPREPTPEQAEVLAALPLLGQSVVAHLARMPQLREELARDAALVERLEALSGQSDGAMWVHEVLARHSGPLLVLHPPSGTGFRLRYENVSNCFHLFSLIQCALGRSIPGGRVPSGAVCAVARGESTERVSDQAWWHYGDPRSKTADIGGSIWGEASVRSIPAFKGVQIILLWPPLLGSRSWDSGFMGPHLEASPSDVVVEAELDEKDCDAWFEELGVAHGRRRTWWPW